MFAQHPGDHPRRAAEVDVALGDVGDELAQVRGREQVAPLLGRVVADDVVERELPAGRELRRARSREDDVAVCAGRGG